MFEYNDSSIDNIKIGRGVIMFPVPVDEVWRVSFVNDIIQSKSEFFYLNDNEVTTEIRNDILEYLCIT